MNPGSRSVNRLSGIIILLSLIITIPSLPTKVLADAPVLLVVDTTVDNGSLTACTSDPGDCSLRGAISHVNADTSGTAPEYEILVGSGTYTLTGAADENNNASGDLDTKPQNALTIIGFDRSVAFINGNHIDRVFDHRGPGRLVLTGLTIQNGQVPSGKGGGAGILNAQTAPVWLYYDTVDSNTVLGATVDDVGGGVRDIASTLRLVGTTISNNQADAGGGLDLNDTTFFMDVSIINGNYANDNFGGGIRTTNGGTYTIYSSQIKDNVALQAGGIYNNSLGTLNMTDTTVSGNSTTAYGGGGMILYGTSSLIGVTISGNSVASGNIGGGIAAYGIVNLVNSTIAYNTATTGGGIYIGKDASVGINHVTDANNSADTGRGSAVYMSSEDTGTGGTFSFTNSIFSSYEPELSTCNSSPGSFTIIDGGYNLFDQTLNCFTHVFTDLTYAYPALGPLSNNGGLTQTMSLYSFSDAIDAASPGDPAFDQRNHSRKDGDGDGLVAADIGAFEYESAVTYLPILLKP